MPLPTCQPNGRFPPDPNLLVQMDGEHRPTASHPDGASPGEMEIGRVIARTVNPTHSSRPVAAVDAVLQLSWRCMLTPQFRGQARTLGPFVHALRRRVGVASDRQQSIEERAVSLQRYAQIFGRAIPAAAPLLLELASLT
jgi:hypothetical protein